MRAGAVCDACFGLMVREDRRRLRLPPCSTLLYPTLFFSALLHLRSPTKGQPTAVYYAHPKITTAMTMRMTLTVMLMTG